MYTIIMLNWIKLGIAVFLIILNSFFVIVQFAFVAVRRTRIAELAKKQQKAAELLHECNSTTNGWSVETVDLS